MVIETPYQTSSRQKLAEAYHPTSMKWGGVENGGGRVVMMLAKERAPAQGTDDRRLDRLRRRARGNEGGLKDCRIRKLPNLSGGLAGSAVF